MFKFIKATLFVTILLIPLLARAQTADRILSYSSDITISADSSMIVKETLRVVSRGDQIKHGIYRDFPIAYKDRLGQRYVVGFNILEITRDGKTEPYHVEKSGNGERIYIGDENVLIPLGEYVYTITYKTDRELGFFSDHDELYWNVTGNGWVFPISSATATVHLPGNIPKDKITATFYTGPQGSTDQNATSHISDSGVEFATTGPLESYEGLTIVVGWPKGIVTPPTAIQNFWAAVHDNADYIVGILGLLLVLAFYLYIWNKRGRDPMRGAIIAQYESPNGFSPAMVRYVSRMGNDNRGFAAAIIDMGVKGKLTVTETKGFFGKKTYTLTQKSDTPKSLAPEEQLLQDKFFAGGNTLELKTANASKISKIRESFYASIRQQAGKKYFTKNGWALGLGIALSIATVIATIIAASIVRFTVESGLQILFWPVFVLALLIINIIFGRLIRAYTIEGRQLADEIEGFKLFLSVTEKDRLAFHNPPEKTPELFEQMLPYALALGVEHKWAEQFADVFARLENQGVHYAPIWYYGSLGHFNPTSFASDIGNSFTGVVSSSSTPPGSSSGGGGGGFSGGGGGGGGGGGW